jgi:hypothetical protein
MTGRARTTALALLVLAAATALQRVDRPVSEPPPPRPPAATGARVLTPTPRPATARQIAAQDRLTPHQRRRDRAALARRRLIEHLPVTLAGVRIAVTGIAADGRRTLLELDPGSRSRRFALALYHQALRVYNERNRDYQLKLIAGARGLGDETLYPTRRTTPPHASAMRTAPATVAPATNPDHPLARPVRAARAYTLAATNWSAVSYPATYRRQLTLAGGPLRRQLRAHIPDAARLRQLRVDAASRLGVVLDAQWDPTSSPVAGNVVVRVAEQRELAGRRTHTNSRYVVRLRLRAHRWQVIGFTATRGRR